MRYIFVLSVVLCSFLPQITVAQSKRDKAVLADRQQFLEDDTWYYDDLNRALEDAVETKRPLMIVFR